jgi:hypothetical protein
MIQIDGTKRHVYLKSVDDTFVQNVLQTTKGSTEYKHVTDEISIERLEAASVGMRRIRIANLPPETLERTLRTALATYGNIVSIQNETWSNA